MEHQQLEEVVAALALRALDDDGRPETERAALEHLTGCATCRELFHDLREVGADLGIAATPRAVPTAVEERILEAIRERRPSGERAPQARRSPLTRVAALAAAAAIAGLFAWNVQLSSRVGDAARRTEAVTEALTFIGSPDVRSASLSGDDGTLVFVWRAGEAFLIGHDVAAPPNGRVLQLWLMREGVPTSAGVFRPDDGVVVLRVTVDPSTFDGVAVTVERAPSGAVRPSGLPTYRGTLTA